MTICGISRCPRAKSQHLATYAKANRKINRRHARDSEYYLFFLSYMRFFASAQAAPGLLLSMGDLVRGSMRGGSIDPRWRRRIDPRKSIYPADMSHSLLSCGETGDRDSFPFFLFCFFRSENLHSHTRGAGTVNSSEFAK